MKLEVSIKKQLANFPLQVSFQTDGETLAFLGASGSGKSMMLKCIAGLETPDAGRIVLDDRVLFDSDKGICLSPQARKIGYLFQNYALFPHMTVEENILFGAHGTQREKAEKLEGELCRFHLSARRRAKPAELSGGERQRAALARILASEAQLLLLDEPFSALDGYLKDGLLHEFDSILARFGGGLYVTHDIREACRMAGRIAVMDCGMIREIAASSVLFLHPTTLIGARLSGFQNISSAVIRNHVLVITDWDIELPLSAVEPLQGDPHKIRYAAVRAENLRQAECRDGAILSAKVIRTIEEPLTKLLIVQGRGSSPLYWRVKKDRIFMDGDIVSLKFSPADLALLCDGR